MVSGSEDVSLRRCEVLLGQSPDIRKLTTLVTRVAKTDEHVLVVGEVGTGTRRLAEYIHRRSTRGEKSFVYVNCTTLSEPDVWSEVMGNGTDNGSAIYSLVQRLRKANGGTLLLENIEDLSEKLQKSLVETLRRRRITIDGSEMEVDLDVRIISTTHTDLSNQVLNRKLRQDLLLILILDSFIVEIPPLRSRKQDIPILFEHFLRKHCKENGRPVPPVPLRIFEPLLEYDWRGNVEELDRCVRSMILLSPRGELSTEFLPVQVKESPFEFLKGKNLEDAISELERYLIGAALRRFGGNRSKAAEHLKVSEATVRYKMRKYNIADEF